MFQWEKRREGNGGNCFFILEKKSVRKTLNTAIIVRKKAKIRLFFGFFFLTLGRPAQHARNTCAWKWGWEKLKRDRSYYSFRKDPTAIWKESRLRWAKCFNGGFALWTDWQEKTLTLSDVWDLAEGSYSRLSCVGASLCCLLGNKGPRRAWTCIFAKNKPRENNNREQAWRDLTPFTKSSLLHQPWLQDHFHGDKTWQQPAGVRRWGEYLIQLDSADQVCSTVSGWILLWSKQV